MRFVICLLICVGVGMDLTLNQNPNSYFVLIRNNLFQIRKTVPTRQHGEDITHLEALLGRGRVFAHHLIENGAERGLAAQAAAGQPGGAVPLRNDERPAAAPLLLHHIRVQIPRGGSEERRRGLLLLFRGLIDGLGAAAAGGGANPGPLHVGEKGRHLVTMVGIVIET
jgi:hypothetical protein